MTILMVDDQKSVLDGLLSGLDFESVDIDRVYLPLINGCVDIDTVLPEFQAALKDAGIDDIIACKQEQMDAWLASNNG